MAGGEVARYLSRHGGKNVSQAALISSVVPYMLKTDDNPNGVDAAIFAQMTAGMKQDRAHFFANFFKSFYGVGVIKHPVSAEVIENSVDVAMQASPESDPCLRGVVRNHRISGLTLHRSRSRR